MVGTDRSQQFSELSTSMPRGFGPGLFLSSHRRQFCAELAASLVRCHPL